VPRSDLLDMYDKEPSDLLYRSNRRFAMQKDALNPYAWMLGAALESRISEYLQQVAQRFKESRWHTEPSDLRSYALPVAEAFQAASKQYPSIRVDSEVMAGAPCLRDTRIPVYMVLDAIEYHGNVEAALCSYPSITLQQVKDAIGFAKLVVECPLDDNSTSPAR
jgi:uncharacterized protein (DUF433 family)